MDPALAISETRLTVDPGGEARTQVTVRNPGNYVAQYRFEILGTAAEWTQVQPKNISLLPGTNQETTVAVIFRPPPAPAAPSGEIAFGVRCVSLERRDDCAVVEGDLIVSAVVDLDTRLQPSGPSGVRKGNYCLLIRNTGTLPLTVAVSAVDGAGLLRFAVAPEEITIKAGERSPVYIAARPRTAKMIGKPVDHTVTVRFEIPGSDRSGEEQIKYQQRALIPKWLLIVAVLLLVIALAIAAWVILRPGEPSGPALKADPPPAIALISANAGADAAAGTVDLSWQQSAYATSYEVQVTRGGAVAGKNVIDAPQTLFTWAGLPPGESCFVVLPVNANGRGPASEPVCTKVSAPSVAPSVSASASVPATSVAATASSAVAGAAFEPQGWYVIYYRSPLDDKAVEGATRSVQAALVAAGAKAQLVDSTTSKTLPDGPSGFWFVLADGFADQAAAQQECALRAAIPLVLCTAEPPG
jgi:hypothetical protein